MAWILCSYFFALLQRPLVMSPQFVAMLAVCVCIYVYGVCVCVLRHRLLTQKSSVTSLKCCSLFESASCLSSLTAL